MIEEKHSIYSKIEAVIDYLEVNSKNRIAPSDIADALQISSYELKQLTHDWAGVSPEEFVEFVSSGYAKSLLDAIQADVYGDNKGRFFDSPHKHDLSIDIEAMTEEDIKNDYENLHINYSFSDSPFGDTLIASTTKGICYMAFFANQEKALTRMKKRFPNAHFEQDTDAMQQNALSLLHSDWNELAPIALHLNGTEFQIKVWETLLEIPLGSLTTYGRIADYLGKPTAARAVGTAIGRNPIAFIVPCHRVIPSSGNIGGYMWGSTRKSAIIAWEAAKINRKK